MAKKKATGPSKDAPDEKCEHGINLPPIPAAYRNPPRNQVLLLTCMDLRLIDNITRFMEADNLQNRYDQLSFAGAAMGVRNLKSPLFKSTQALLPTPLPWRIVFLDHLVTAVEGLKREIEDIFIVEHLDCGAYKKLHPCKQVQEQYEAASQTNMSWLVKYHAEEAHALAEEILQFCAEQADVQAAEVEQLLTDFDADDADRHQLSLDVAEAERLSQQWRKIKVRTFIMDLKGIVSPL